MALKLDKNEQEFRNPQVFYPDHKTIDLDRVLVNLYILLRCDGQRPASRRRPPRQIEKVEHHRKTLARQAANEGFDTYPEVARAWLESDVFDIVNRGKGPEREAVASLRPLHLDAAKLRVARYCRDYNVSEHVYANLEHGGQQTLKDLKAYLDRGRDTTSDLYDGNTRLDLETLAVLKLTEVFKKSLHPSGEKATKHAPVCVGQARVLNDDLQRLLAYQDEIPRGVMIEYLRALFGLHTALYTLRLSHQLPGWIAEKKAHDACMNCPVTGGSDRPFEGCPYTQSFVVDMGGDPKTPMGQMATESAAGAYARIYDFISALFSVNQLLQYQEEHKQEIGLPVTPANAVGILSAPPADFETWFRIKLKQIRDRNQARGEEPKPEEAAIFDLDLPQFEKFIELITQVRARHHRTYIVQFLDSLFQKNTAYGALEQGRSRSQGRRWRLGGRLLELFVQLAVLQWKDEGTKKAFYSEPILLDHFIAWVEARYGFAIAGPPPGAPPASLEEQRAYRDNVRALKDQLREIGFFDDLSDAFNAQTIRPRYPIDQRGGVE